jgi:hypothetical protein
MQKKHYSLPGKAHRHLKTPRLRCRQPGHDDHHRSDRPSSLWLHYIPSSKGRGELAATSIAGARPLPHSEALGSLTAEARQPCYRPARGQSLWMRARLRDAPAYLFRQLILCRRDGPPRPEQFTIYCQRALDDEILRELELGHEPSGAPELLAEGGRC